MAHYIGRTTIEVEATADVTASLGRDLDAALNYVKLNHNEVRHVRVEWESNTITVHMGLENVSADALDDVADRVLEEAFKILRDEDSDDEELVVMESSLVRA